MATAGLRKQYEEALEKFHFYERGLLIAKQDIREHMAPHLFPEDATCPEETLQNAIDRYEDYKFVVKCQSSELRELKHAIREYDKTHSSIALT